MPAREHQKFADFPAEPVAAVAFPWFRSTEEVTMDHLGVFLAWKLCHILAGSGARQTTSTRIHEAEPV